MSKNRRHVFQRHNKMVGIPEEVGMDIVEVLDVILFKNQKEKSKKIHNLKHSIEQNLGPNKVPGPLIYQTSSNLRLIHQEFCRELKNELENAPLPSSSNLSTYFRSPSRSVLFRETSTTLGHLQGNSQKCQITLTPQVLSLFFFNRTLHIIIEDIRLLQMDEFKKILQIYAANVPENPPIIIENFPPKRLEKFLLILSYLMARPKQKLVYCFSWNFALKRQKKPEILGAYPVTLTVESHIQTEAMRCQIEYKIQDLVHDEAEEAIEIMENNEIWQQNGTWQIKLNSLFLFVDDKEIPAHFWLLSQLVEISQLDSDEEEFLLELVFDAELVIFRFETQEILEEWKSRLDEAKNFDPSKFFSGENVTDVKEIFVALDNSNLLIFNMDLKWRTYNKNCYLLTSVNDLKVKDSKPEVSLVRKTELWRLSFGNYGECNEFITKFKRLWKKK